MLLCVPIMEFCPLIEPKMMNRRYSRVPGPGKDIVPGHDGANLLYNYMYYYRLLIHVTLVYG